MINLKNKEKRQPMTLPILVTIHDKLKFLKLKERINMNLIVEHYITEGLKKDYPTINEDMRILNKK